MTGAAAVVLLAVGLFHARAYVNDDAFISLRYADRLVAGQGLTWTDGERVEGFTNPLWVLQAAAFGAAGLDPATAVRLLGAAYLLLLLAVVWRASRWPAALLLIATHRGLVTWSVSGLETVGFAAWLVLGTWLAWRAGEVSAKRATANASGAGLALAAAALTRPEGIAAGVLVIGLMMVRSRRAAGADNGPGASGSARNRATGGAPPVTPATGKVLLAAGLFAIPLAAYLVFRLAYYGGWLPNVAYAKGAGLAAARQWQGALDYARDQWLEWVPVGACAVVAFAGTTRRSTFWMLVPALPLIAGIVFAAGDYMPFGRLLVPVVALAVLALAVAAGSPRPRGSTPILACVLVAAAVQAWVFWTTPIVRDSAAAIGEPVGRFLEEKLPPGSLVALATAGSPPHAAPSLRFLDTIGLNDRHIAHRPAGPVLTRLQRYSGHLKGDGAYVLSRRPDVIVLGPAEGYRGAVANAWFLTDYELLQSPEFREMYHPFQFAVPVDTRAAAHPRIRELLDPGGQTMRFIAFLRLDSTAALELAYSGKMMQPPWPWTPPARR